jgi:peptidoglycan hydrolase-like protein with peptidoglycan-binding domain
VRRRAGRLVPVVTLGAAVAGVTWLALRPGAGTEAAAPTAPPRTVSVARTTLVEQEALDGTLGYAGQVSVVNQLGGTVTRLAGKGEVVERGQVLYEVDGRPVRLLHGDRPAWRTLAEGVADGPDVRQLEENLVALGHANRRNLTVDDKFSAATTEAVKRWQKAIGVDQDGVVELGEVVFLPTAVRVTEHPVTAGAPAQPGGTVLSGTTATRVVTVDLEARRQGLVKVGDAIEVELPDGRRTPGKVTEVARVADDGSRDDAGDGGAGPGGGGGDEDPTVEVTITLDDPAATGALDQTPVEVQVTRDRAENVLAVPVNALLALAEGGYAVEVVEGGARRLVRVEIGLFARGLVEVSGDGLDEGDQAVVPS